MSRPKISSAPLYQLLREGNIEEFNARKAKGELCDLTYCDFSRLDLKGLDAAGLDLSNGYFRMTDLRGIDFRETRLEGSSFAAANISGTYFPKEMEAEEILLSINHGTRIRYR